jgi:hypothetical protein
MTHWKAMYRDRSLGRTSTSSDRVGVRQTCTDEVLLEARFACPMCGNSLAPGVQCGPCRAWAVDSTSRLHLSADNDSFAARFSRWRQVRAAHARRDAGMVRATIHTVHEDSTPSDPNRLVAAYASRVGGSYHSVWGGFSVELSSGAERTHAHLAITNANLIVPSLARGERREFVIGDEVILTGKHLDETFFGDVWLERG